MDMAPIGVKGSVVGKMENVWKVVAMIMMIGVHLGLIAVNAIIIQGICSTTAKNLATFVPTVIVKNVFSVRIGLGKENISPLRTNLRIGISRIRKNDYSV